MLSLDVSKTVAAPRARVFAAWTDPELVKLWFAPGDMTVGDVSIDAKVGGRFRIVMQGADMTPTAIGEYKEIVANEKLVFSWAWESDPSQPTIVTVTFHDHGSGTRIELIHERLPSKESRDRHEHGWIGCLGNLAKKIAV
jgi:uncharacterized protein YndB with AHSA1/START domain